MLKVLISVHMNGCTISLHCYRATNLFIIFEFEFFGVLINCRLTEFVGIYLFYIVQYQGFYIIQIHMLISGNLIKRLYQSQPLRNDWPHSLVDSSSTFCRLWV